MDVDQKKPSTTVTTRQLLARAGEYELRLQALEYRQACTAWILAEFLHHWRMSILAAYHLKEGKAE